MHFFHGRWVCLALVFLAACAPQTAQSQSEGPFSLPTQGGTVLPGDPLMDIDAVITVVKSRIVVSMVELSEGAYLSTVTLFVPAELLEAEVFVNGEKDALLVVNDPTAGTMTLSLFAMQPTSQANITFVTGDELLASCTIEVNQSIEISGDCGW